MKDHVIIAVLSFLVVLGLLLCFGPKKAEPIIDNNSNSQFSSPLPIAPIEQRPLTPNITITTPIFLPYSEIVKQLNEWHTEAPDLTKIGTYGKSSQGADLYYIRVRNFKSEKTLPKLLITACIHGNEPHATSTVMAYIGNMLASYGKDERITKLIDERDIFFVPVVSPDSYPHSRQVDGVDPNRDFDKKKSAAVRGIQSLFEAEKFNAAWSGHTWGRVFLMPWGDNMEKCPDDATYRTIMDEVAGLANYKLIRACEMYNAGGGLNDYPPIRYGSKEWSPYKAMSPIYGAELDWYYRHNCFAVVCEYGTHQHKPSYEETLSEFNRTFKAFLCFVEKAPVATLTIKEPFTKVNSIEDMIDYVNE